MNERMSEWLLGGEKRGGRRKEGPNTEARVVFRQISMFHAALGTSNSRLFHFFIYTAFGN